MTRPPRRRVKATAKATARVVDKRKKELRRVDRTTIHDLVVPHGDGECGIGHSAKWGASDKASWMTVESMCYVKVPCAATAAAIEEAGDACSRLAYKIMHDNASRVQEDLGEYLEGGK